MSRSAVEAEGHKVLRKDTVTRLSPQCGKLEPSNGALHMRKWRASEPMIRACTPLFQCEGKQQIITHRSQIKSHKGRKKFFFGAPHSEVLTAFPLIWGRSNARGSGRSASYTTYSTLSNTDWIVAAVFLCISHPSAIFPQIPFSSRLWP